MKTCIYTILFLFLTAWATAQGIYVRSHMVVASGTMVNATGDVVVKGGDLTVNSKSELIVGDGKSLVVNQGGVITLTGNASHHAVIRSGGYFNFSVGSNGTISAQYALFEKMNGSGVTISPGAFIDPAGAFGNSVFQNGSAGGTLLTVNNNQDVTLFDVDFPGNTWGGQYNAAKTVDYGSLTFVDPTGAFSGESYEDDAYNRIHWPSASFFLDITVNLQGPYSGTAMNTGLNPVYLPLSQPYSAAPWNYAGTESVTSVPSPSIVDWILVELRDAANPSAAGSSTMVARKAAFLLSNGKVAAMDGSSNPEFSVGIADQLFVVIHHRNHISIMTSASPPLSGGTYTWDFTTGANQAHGGSNGHKEISSGVWGMAGGDGNADNQINNGDKNDVWSPQAGTGGYKAGDFNLDGQVNNGDKNDVWVPNTGSGGQVPVLSPLGNGVPADGYKSQVPL